jgi:hypothetical protein
MRDTGVARMLVYKEWVLKKILQVSSTQSVVVVPVDDAQPNYRDAQPL